MPESMITIRVPREMKVRMRRAGVNWSEELRRVIETKLEDDRRRRADAELGTLVSRMKPGFDSAMAIREAREHG